MTAADLGNMTLDERDMLKVETCTTLDELENLQAQWRARRKELSGDVVAAIARARRRLAIMNSGNRHQAPRQR